MFLDVGLCHLKVYFYSYPYCFYPRYFVNLAIMSTWNLFYSKLRIKSSAKCATCKCICKGKCKCNDPHVTRHIISPILWTQRACRRCRRWFPAETGAIEGVKSLEGKRHSPCPPGQPPLGWSSSAWRSHTARELLLPQSTTIQTTHFFLNI